MLHRTKRDYHERSTSLVNERAGPMHYRAEQKFIKRHANSRINLLIFFLSLRQAFDFVCVVIFLESLNGNCIIKEFQMN